MQSAISIRQHSIVTTDGFPLAVASFEPRVAQATVIVNGATATPQRYYRRFAEWLARRGNLRVVTYDYRGIGASRPHRLSRFDATLGDWATLDARGVHAWVRRRHPGPVLLVGHSFGGQLIGLLDELRAADGALLVGAQLGYYGHWPRRERARLAAIWHVATPVLVQTLGYLPGWAGLGVDLPGGVAAEWAKWCRSPDYLLSHVPEARERFARFQPPTLALSFTDDDFAPAPAVEAFLRLLPPQVEHRRIAPSDAGVDRIGHFGFFRPEHQRTLWESALAFLRSSLASSQSLAIPVSFEWPMPRAGAPELAPEDVPS